MDIDNYFTFLLIAFGYIASPGPAVFIAINGGASLGKVKTSFILLGNSLGLGIIALISAIGVGAFILKSNVLTTVTTTAGASWLCYLGIRMVISHVSVNQINNTADLERNTDHFKRFYSGLALALTNPKPIVFFVFIYPQFIIPNSTKNMQLLLLEVTFMLLSFITLNTYSFISNAIVGKVLNEYRVRLFNIISGIVFIVLKGNSQDLI